MHNNSQSREDQVRSSQGSRNGKPPIIAQETDLIISTQNKYSADQHAGMYDASPKLQSRELTPSKMTKMAKSVGSEVTAPKMHGATKVTVDANQLQARKSLANSYEQNGPGDSRAATSQKNYLNTLKAVPTQSITNEQEMQFMKAGIPDSDLAEVTNENDL